MEQVSKTCFCTCIIRLVISERDQETTVRFVIDIDNQFLSNHTVHDTIHDTIYGIILFNRK